MRSPLVAGQFYPGTKDELLNDLDTLIPSGKEKKDVIGIMTPHAGYMFSGAVAGEVFAGIVPKSTYIILGPSHTGKGARIASDKEPWSTPIDGVEIDIELLDAIMAKTTVLTVDKLAHTFEHSIEVQIPFIQKISPDARILPITIQQGSLIEYTELAKAMANVIKQTDKDIIIVSSTDMTHYETRKMAKYKDQMAIDEVLKIDGEGLLRVVEEHRISMCGYIPTSIMLMAAKEMGAVNAELVSYTDSGAITGDTSEVVGYAGIVVY